MEVLKIRNFQKLCVRSQRTRRKWSLRPRFEVNERCSTWLDREHERLIAYEQLLQDQWEAEQDARKERKAIREKIDILNESLRSLNKVYFPHLFGFGDFYSSIYTVMDVFQREID